LESEISVQNAFHCLSFTFQTKKQS